LGADVHKNICIIAIIVNNIDCVAYQ